MQQASTQEHADYATLGMRLAAVLIDTVVLFGVLILVMTVYILVLAGQGRIDPQDPAAAQELSRQLTSSGLPFNLLFFAALFVYYVVLESLFAASVGKLVLGMRVTMRDGSRVTGLAVVLRNLVRIPEAMLLYIPAGISCLLSPRRERLGDHAARTVVVRRQRHVTVVYASPQARPFAAPGAPPAGAPYGASGAGPAGPPAPPPPASSQAWPAQDETAAVPAWAPPPTPDAALARLKTAALAARGAHLTYLHFSEKELADSSAEHTGDYSEAYVSAWFTLADAVAELKAARSDLDRAAANAGVTTQEVVAPQADLAHLLAELGPYFAAGDEDGEVHDAFLAVARAEAAPPTSGTSSPSAS